MFNLYYLYISILVVLLFIFFGASFRVVHTGNIYLVERFGKFYKTLEPGWHVIIPFIDSISHEVNIKISTDEIYNQILITKDKSKIDSEAVIFYKIFKPEDAYYKVNYYVSTLRETAVIKIRQAVEEHTLTDLQSNMTDICTKIKESLNFTTKDFGVEILNVEIKISKILS